MPNEDEMRKSIDILAKRYRQQGGNKISHDQARKRIIKAINKER